MRMEARVCGTSPQARPAAPVAGCGRISGVRLSVRAMGRPRTPAPWRSGAWTGRPWQRPRRADWLPPRRSRSPWPTRWSPVRQRPARPGRVAVCAAARHRRAAHRVHVSPADPARDARFFEGRGRRRRRWCPARRCCGRSAGAAGPGRGPATSAPSRRRLNGWSTPPPLRVPVSGRPLTSCLPPSSRPAGRIVEPGRMRPFCPGCRSNSWPLSRAFPGEAANNWRTVVAHNRTLGQFASALPPPGCGLRFDADAVAAATASPAVSPAAGAGARLPPELDGAALRPADRPFDAAASRPDAGRRLHRSLEGSRSRVHPAGYPCRHWRRRQQSAATGGSPGGELTRVWRCAEPLTGRHRRPGALAARRLADLPTAERGQWARRPDHPVAAAAGGSGVRRSASAAAGAASGGGTGCGPAAPWSGCRVCCQEAVQVPVLSGDVGPRSGSPLPAGRRTGRRGRRRPSMARTAAQPGPRAVLADDPVGIRFDPQGNGCVSRPRHVHCRAGLPGRRRLRYRGELEPGGWPVAGGRTLVGPMRVRAPARAQVLLGHTSSVVAYRQRR